MAPRYVQDVRAIAALALQSGGTREGPLTVQWDLAGDCESAFRTEMTGRPAKDAPKDEGNSSFTVWLLTRCRRCTKCLEHRATLWGERAKLETACSSRTWFVTLTLNPEARFIALTRARAKQTGQSEDFDTLSSEQQFIRWHEQISPDITKYLKRVRSQSNAPLRYLLVCEKHPSSGAPHYHMLVHELDPAIPVTHRVLTDQWKLGFTKVKLCDVRTARYVCKYLSKSMEARVRASLFYGDPSQGIVDLMHYRREVITTNEAVRETDPYLLSLLSNGARDAQLSN